DSNNYHGVAFFNTSPVTIDFVRTHPISPGRHTITARVALERHTIQVADVQADPEYGYVLRDEEPIRTELGVPMFRDDEIVGVIILFKVVVEPFTDKQIELVETFADQAVIAIENVRLFKELQSSNRDLSESRERQTATGEILRVISGSPTDVQPVLDAVAEAAARLCGANDAIIRRLDGEFLRPWAHYGSIALPASGGDLRLSPGWPIGRAILERRRVHISDIARPQAIDEYPDARSAAVEVGFRTILAVPLLRDGLAIGAILIRRMEVRPFTDRQIELLKTFADQAVIAIENVRLFNELQEKNRALTEAHAQVSESLEQQTATSNILRVISTSPTDVRPVFNAIVQNARRLCGADSAAVLTYDGKLIQIEALDNFYPERAHALRQAYPMPVNRGHASGRAILTGRPVHIPDVREDFDYTLDALRDAAELRSVLSVPMIRDGNPIGTITVASGVTSRPFSDTQIALLKTFADQAVIAIENVRLFTELQSTNRELTTALDQQTATSEILRALSSSLSDVQPVFNTIVQSGLRLLGGYSASMMLLRDDGRLDLVAYTSTSADADSSLVDAFPMPLSRVPPGERAIHERRAHAVEDVESAPDATDVMRKTGQARGWSSNLFVPMIRDDVAA